MKLPSFECYIILSFCEQDSVLDAVLKQAYKMFKVLNLLLPVGDFMFWFY